MCMHLCYSGMPCGFNRINQHRLKIYINIQGATVVNKIIIAMSIVYAIEASDIARQAQLVIASNNMQDRITIVHDKVEVCIQVKLMGAPSLR